MIDLRDVKYRVRALKNGVEAEDLLWDAGRAPTVIWDKDGEIKSSFAGTFYPSKNVDLLSDEIKPFIIINGTEYPLGVFRASTVGSDNSQYSPLVHIEAYDRCWRLQSNRIESVLHFGAGTPYIAAIEQLLTECGITLRIVTPSNVAFQTDREDWEIGTDYLTIINQLLNELNYSPIWFDVDGVAHVEPYQEVSARRILHRYGDIGAPNVFNPSLASSSSEIDLFSMPNVFICICSNPELSEPMVAVAENDNPSSSTSIFRRGMRIAQRYQVDNIASQTELQAYANKLRNESMFATQILTFQSYAEGGHGIGDIISINSDQIDGIYEETAWSITMQAGQMMKHTARKEISTV